MCTVKYMCALMCITYSQAFGSRLPSLSSPSLWKVQIEKGCVSSVSEDATTGVSGRYTLPAIKTRQQLSNLLLINDKKTA